MNDSQAQSEFDPRAVIVQCEKFQEMLTDVREEAVNTWNDTNNPSVMVAYINALLSEARSCAIKLQGEKYMYDIFLLSAVGRDVLLSMREAYQEADQLLSQDRKQ